MGRDHDLSPQLARRLCAHSDCAFDRRRRVPRHPALEIQGAAISRAKRIDHAFCRSDDHRGDPLRDRCARWQSRHLFLPRGQSHRPLGPTFGADRLWGRPCDTSGAFKGRLAPQILPLRWNSDVPKSRLRCDTTDQGAVDSFTIVTQPAGAPLNGYHDRAPVVLFGNDWARWLNTEVDVTALLGQESCDRFTIEKVEI